MWARRGLVALLCASLLGCSKDERAPYIDLDAPEGGAGPGTNMPDGMDTGSITEGYFASDGMYLVGTVAQGDTSGIALARLSEPSGLAVGFAGGTDLTSAFTWDLVGLGEHDTLNPRYSLSVKKNKLLYIPNTPAVPYGLTEFVPDADGDGYPEAPYDNDIVLETPACPATEDSTAAPRRFLVSPDDRMIYLCEDGWYEGEDYVLPADIAVQTFGRGGKVSYRSGDFAAAIASLGSEDEPGLVNLLVIPDIRPHGSGFHAVAGRSEGLLSLVAIDTAGQYQELGSYPELPGHWDGLVLDENDLLYALYLNEEEDRFEVARASMGDIATGEGGKIEVVYSADGEAFRPEYLFCPP